MSRKASYPDWVMKHVKKGQYINEIKGNYYLYEAHSERKEGIAHPVRVCDGYIGRITQDEGLIPSRKRNQSETGNSSVSSLPAKTNVWVFGLIFVVLQCTRTIFIGLQKTYAEKAPLIYAVSILEAIYGLSTQTLYEMSVLSFIFPDITIPSPENRSDIQTGLERGKRMILDSIDKKYGDDWPLLKAYVSASVIIKNTRGYRVTDILEYAPDLFRKYNLSLDIHAFEELKKWK